MPQTGSLATSLDDFSSAVACLIVSSETYLPGSFLNSSGTTRNTTSLEHNKRLKKRQTRFPPSRLKDRSRPPRKNFLSAHSQETYWRNSYRHPYYTGNTRRP